MIRQFVKNQLDLCTWRRAAVSLGIIGMLVAYQHMPINGKLYLPQMAGGILVGAAGSLVSPVLNIHTTGSGATETIPSSSGFSVMEIQCWGGGGAGGGSAGSGTGGSGGGAGGYSRASFNIAASGGKTLTYTVGTNGVGVSNSTGGSGIASSVSSGTFAISTITCNGGGGGAANGGAVGSGGTVTDANSGATNTTGPNGSLNSGSTGGSGGTGTTGNVTGDGSPYGGGGQGHAGGVVGAGVNGTAGAAVFFYT